MKNLWLRNFILIAIAIVGLLSFLPDLMPDFWYIDIFSHFRVQYLLGAVLLLLAVLWMKSGKWMAFILLVPSVLWNALAIMPYYLQPETVVTDELLQLKISGINLLSSNKAYDEVRSYIQAEDPDLLVLMEYNSRWDRALEDVLASYPYRQLTPRDDNFGIALFSKLEMKAAINYFDIEHKPSIIGKFRVRDHRFTLVATHPVPPLGKAKFEQRNRQLSNILESFSSSDEHLILIGDLNMSSFSGQFEKLLDAGLKDSRMGFGLLPTWPADTRIMQTTLDHCLVSDGIRVIDRKTGRPVGSDHLPVQITVGIP